MILYIDHPESDYGSSYLYNGLCGLLGDQQVLDLPRKASFHGEVQEYTLPNGSPGLTAPAEWQTAREDALPDTPHFADRRAEAVSLLRTGKVQAVFLGSLRPTAVDTFLQIQGEVLRVQVPVVVHDGEDGSGLQMPLLRQIHPMLLLKREFIPKETPRELQGILSPVGGKRLRTYVVGFPFSYPDEHLGSDEEALQAYRQAFLRAAMLCGRTHDMRQKVADAVRAAAAASSMEVYVALSPDYPRDGISTGDQLKPWKEYQQTLASAQFGISVRGHGYDTCRYWEVPAHTVLLCDDLPIEIPAPFEHGKHCFRYRTPEQAVELLRAEYPAEELDRVFQRGRAHLRACHTNKVRARYALDMVESRR